MDENNIVRRVSARLPTDLGEFQLYLYTSDLDHKAHLALVMGDLQAQSDVLGSRRCDCGEQLRYAMQAIAATGSGVIVYLRQEGRGIGLLDKLRAYNLQDQGYDTVEANLLLGHQADERDYTMAAGILADLGVQSIRLLTNNPLKINHLRQLGVQVIERVPVESTVNADNYQYLFTKAQRMHHLLDLVAPSLPSDSRKNGSH